MASALVMLATILAAPGTASAQNADSNGGVRRVVILNSTDPYLPAFMAIDSAMREAIEAQTLPPTELYSEALDMHRFPRDLLEGGVVALMRKKYRDLKVDVVVTAAPIALDFAQHHRDAIWPGAAIVFNSIPPSSLGEPSLGHDTVGVPVQFEYGETLGLALRLRPNTRHVAVIAGRAGSDRSHLAHAKESIAKYANQVDIQYLVDLTLDDAIAAVEKLPPDSVVLYLTMFRDGAGVPHVPRDVLKRIAAASQVPVFGVFETYLGHGITAGSITAYSEQGRRTGEMVARVLNGEAPSAIGIQPAGAPGCIADWQQLQRWGMDQDRLPPDCEIRFRTVGVWDQYRWPILAVLTVILAQTATIFALAMSRRRLKQSQESLAEENGRRIQVEELAAQLRGRLARFSKQHSLGTMATAIAHEINQPLIAIQNYAQAVKRRIQNEDDDRPKLIELVTKIEGQAQRAGTITRRVRAVVDKSPLQPQRVSLYPLIEEAIRMMQEEIDNRNCEIVCEANGIHPTVSADGLQIQLVLVNLLQNAMKSVCSQDGSDRHIDIDVRMADEKQVQVSVTDRGIGISPTVVTDIFEPFSSNSREGMGMGLAVSRTIIEAHGGRLWHEPNPEGGAIFRFTLRVADS